MSNLGTVLCQHLRIGDYGEHNGTNPAGDISQYIIFHIHTIPS